MTGRIGRAALALATMLVPAMATAQDAPAATPAAPASVTTLTPQIEAMFETWAREQHVPGLVWGIVRDGRLSIVRGIGVRDPGSSTTKPVDADTLFRIASMSKAFTALAILDLRDRGRMSLDAPAETYVPELRGWAYPTKDSPKIRVRDLLNHVAGFVDDNPWGDRQQPMPEREFTALLKQGVPFSRGPQSAMEYSNFGYATLGRIVSNVSGKPYQKYIRERIMAPLGMKSTGYDIARSPADRRAIGYRREGERYVREPDMADGAFGAMGGVQTSANDYAKYVAWLLSAWPARDDAEGGPLRRSTVREIVQGSNFTVVSPRRAALGTPCASANSYAMGWQVVTDCDLSYVTHTGGYPGYGSVVILMPESGVGIFAFASRTYAPPVAPAYTALLAMKAAGVLAPRPVPVSDRVREGYAAVGAMWAAGDVMVVEDRLAMNVLMDRSARLRAQDIMAMKAQTGSCDTAAPIEATTAMAGRFRWRCEKAVVAGSILLAPTQRATLQEWRLRVEPPTP